MRGQRESPPDEEPLLQKKNNNPPKDKQTWPRRVLEILALMGSPWAAGNIGFFC